MDIEKIKEKFMQIRERLHNVYHGKTVNLSTKIKNVEMSEI